MKSEWFIRCDLEGGGVKVRFRPGRVIVSIGDEEAVFRAPKAVSLVQHLHMATILAHRYPSALDESQLRLDREAAAKEYEDPGDVDWDKFPSRDEWRAILDAKKNPGREH